MHNPYVIEIQPHGAHEHRGACDLVFRRVLGWHKVSPGDFWSFDFFGLVGMRRQNHYSLRIWRDLYSLDKLAERLHTLFPPDLVGLVTIDGVRSQRRWKPQAQPPRVPRHPEHAALRGTSSVRRAVAGIQLEMHQLLRGVESVKGLVLATLRITGQALTAGNSGVARVQLEKLGNAVQALEAPVGAMLQALDRKKCQQVQ